MFSHWIPKGPIAVAFSGGSDSVFVAEHFIKERRDVTLLHINHGTAASGDMERFVRSWAHYRPVNLIVENIDPTRPKDQSWEEHWRNERLKIFHSYNGIVVTGHNLDDQIETYLFNAFHGNPRLMPSSYGNVIRPFMFNTKQEMRTAVKTEWFEDVSNVDLKYARNRIRHNIVGEVRKINPGIETTIKKMMVSQGYGIKGVTS